MPFVLDRLVEHGGTLLPCLKKPIQVAEGRIRVASPRHPTGHPYGWPPRSRLPGLGPTPGTPWKPSSQTELNGCSNVAPA